jgi:hypothetical protein
MIPEHEERRPWRVIHAKYALLTGLTLCLANTAMDFILQRLGMAASETILNDVAIGALGAAAVFFFLAASHERQNFQQAKQRIVLIGELNARIRRAFGELAAAALSEDRLFRLRGIDEATEHIDLILLEFEKGS